MKLNQVLAIEKGIKTSSQRALTDLHKKSQQATLYEGRERVYAPAAEDGEVFPPESQKVQLHSRDVLKDLQAALSELFDITYTKDHTNLTARADVVVDGKTLLEKVPVTYLLFLEKQLTDLHTFVVKLPTLPTEHSFLWDDAQGVFRTGVTKTHKTKKVTKPVVLYEATKEHPAQVKEVSEDVVIGYWQQTIFSGALTVTKKDLILSRVDTLLRAVKFAREEANSVPASKTGVAGKIFGYLLE